MSDKGGATALYQAAQELLKVLRLNAQLMKELIRQVLSMQ